MKRIRSLKKKTAPLSTPTSSSGPPGIVARDRLAKLAHAFTQIRLADKHLAHLGGLLGGRRGDTL